MRFEKILIADDHSISRKGLIETIKAVYNNKTLFIEAENGKEAIEKYNLHFPDLVFLDIEMPLTNGIEVCKHIKNKNVTTKVIFVSMHTDETIIDIVKRSKGDGHLSKTDNSEVIKSCFNHILGKNSFFTSVNKHSNLISSNTEYHRITNLISNLTNTEEKVLKYLHKGNSAEEIVEKLFISQKSLNNYRSRICKKLDLPPQKNSLLQWTYKNKEILKILFIKP